MLDGLTIVLMLLAALLHASWHSLVKYGGDQRLVLAGMGFVATAISVCALPFVPPLPAQVWPVMAVSVALHVGYKIALARAYAVGELGQAFPLARGFVPLFATVIAFVTLGQLPAGGQIAGIAIVSAGLLWLAAHSLRGGAHGSLVVAALAAGATVAGYTVLDAYGTRLAGDWLAFTAWLVVLDSLTYGGLVYAAKGNALWRELWRQRGRMLVAGVLGVLSFTVYLWALSRNAVGPVSALRESSVLFAALIGMALHREQVSAGKVAAACVITLGLVLVGALR